MELRIGSAEFDAQGTPDVRVGYAEFDALSSISVCIGFCEFDCLAPDTPADESRPAGGAPGKGKGSKSRKYVVTKHGRTLVFRDRQLAEQMLHEDDEPPAPATKRKKAAPKVEQTPAPDAPRQVWAPRVDLAEAKRQARLQAAEIERRRTLEQAHYAALMSQLRIKQNAEDEQFLLAASA